MQTKTAAAAGESEYRECTGVAASSRHRAVSRGQNRENAQVVRPVQKRHDFRAIKGIGPRRMEKMRKYVTVGKSVAPKNATSSRTASSAPPPTVKSPPRAPTVKQNPATAN